MVLEKTLEGSGTWHVYLRGDIDLYNAEEMRSALVEIADRDILLDCTELTYIDSTGLGVLVGVQKQAETYGKSISICGLKPYLYKIFELTNLHKLFNIEVSG